MEIEHILGLRMFSIQGLACGLVPELHSQTKIELDSFINIRDWKFHVEKRRGSKAAHNVNKWLEGTYAQVEVLLN